MNFSKYISIDMLLIGVLVILMYHQPHGLVSFTQSVLGKVVAVFLIGVLALNYGRNCGLIAAVIFILLLHQYREGLEKKKASPKEEKKAPPKEEEKEKPKEEEKEKPKEEKKEKPKEQQATKGYPRGRGSLNILQKSNPYGVRKAPPHPNPALQPSSHPYMIPKGAIRRRESGTPLLQTDNIVDRDRSMKISPLLNSQEERGHYGGEEEGILRRPIY